MFNVIIEGVKWAQNMTKSDAEKEKALLSYVFPDATIELLEKQ